MVYNPEFFEKMTPVERAGVLKHEFYHLVRTRHWSLATRRSDKDVECRY